MGLLSGMTVLEIGGIGPGPFCAMLLADLGADVLRIEKPGKKAAGFEERPSAKIVSRNKTALTLDLKSPDAVEVIKIMVRRADAIIEGFRPGVMERLGLGPDDLMGENPALIYGRITGWGQAGPWSQRAGHDINYLAVAGALSLIGRKGEPPTVPLNLIGDYGGGGMYLAFGILSAAWAAKSTGKGQVVDAAMIDGISSLMAPLFEMRANGQWTRPRGENLLDGGAPWYDVYQTKDEKFLAVGAIEPKFYAAFLDGLGIDPNRLPPQYDHAGWPVLRETFSDVIRQRTRSEWMSVFDARDACVSPVLGIHEAAAHPQMKFRGTQVEVDGVVQPAPGPRVVAEDADSDGVPDDDTATDPASILRAWGVSEEDIERLRTGGGLA